MNSHDIFKDAWTYIYGPQWQGVSLYGCFYAATAVGFIIFILLNARRARALIAVFVLLGLVAAALLQLPAQCQRWHEQAGIQNVNPYWAPEDRFANFVLKQRPLPDRCLFLSEDKSLYLRYKLAPYIDLKMTGSSFNCILAFQEPYALNEVPADFKVKAQYNGASLMAIKR